ncbi:MAG TPA: hypothetical protein DDW94_05655 [Deltaproteobacteria bacterium]|nr:MAG: hypothetical protein A3I81_10675 [Deltaproteobacteria bacterium RIFCSPLOWO2_02_FULL_55_12]HBG46460.1 hypothetical protein [Deltaproteobacteria bacterium]HCY10672.1 hypothetical protein [Deltaproteobacteria bacterium]
MGIALLTAIGLSLMMPAPSEAVPSFARKHNMSCTNCHTVFPRLNTFGTNFLRNGFQIAAGGDEPTTKLDFESALDLLSIRGKMTVVKAEVDQTLDNGQTGTDYTIGTGEDFYLYAAGSVWKNLSLWVENSLKNGSTSNYAVGFHNLGGTSLANIRVGHLTNTEWLSVSNQKRFLDPAYIGYAVSTSSSSSGLDRVTSGGAPDAIEYYGYQGPVFVGAGLTSGSTNTDANENFNYWATLRLDAVGMGEFSASNVSVQYYSGTDTNSTNVKNEFNFTIIGADFEWRNLSLYGFYVLGDEDNWNFAGTEREHTGYGIEANYIINPKLAAALRYERVESDDDPTIEKGLITPGVIWSIRPNIRAMALYVYDLDDDGNGKRTNSQAFANLQFAY